MVTPPAGASTQRQPRSSRWPPYRDGFQALPTTVRPSPLIASASALVRPGNVPRSRMPAPSQRTACEPVSVLQVPAIASPASSTQLAQPWLQ